MTVLHVMFIHWHTAESGTYYQRRRLKWFGHVLWKDDGRLPKETCIGRQTLQSKSLENWERTRL